MVFCFGWEGGGFVERKCLNDICGVASVAGVYGHIT